MPFPVPGNVLTIHTNDENDADTNLETDALVADVGVGVDGDGHTTQLKIWISFSNDESK